MKPASPPLTASQAWWLLAAGSMAALPLAAYLPPWLATSAAAAFVLRAGLIRTQRAAPARWVLALAVVAGCLAVFAQYRTLFGQNAGVALLVLLLTLKQLESAVRRDGLAIVLLCYFLVLTSFFYAQSMAHAAAMLAAVVIATATLGNLADSRLAPPQLLKNAALMLAQASPFLLILFVLFPRVSGPLWGLPRDAYSALSGLSDSMTPGSISKLSQSDAIAFRARFADQLPPRHQLYWRGPVLTQFDGQTWRPTHFTLGNRLPYASDRPSTGYEITLEAHNKPWLFVLELPAQLPPDALFASDYQTLAKAPVTQRLRYTARSWPGSTSGVPEPSWVLAGATRLPPDGNPRTLALGRRWRAAADSDRAILRLAVDFFRGQALTYTLEPPLLGTDSVDAFLFDTRQGFCEHFAGAFVFAMRAAGVPTRVVTGYQGGELNPVDGYLTVRQSDAHAWAEVWLQGQGWTRIDPTAASNPRRVEQNLAAAVPAGDPLPLLMRFDLPWLHELRYRWEAAANTWNQWVLGYNPERQRELLTRLGMQSPDWQRMTSVLTGLAGAVVLGLLLWALHQHRHRDPALRLWLRATRRLARHGLACRAWEGPHDFSRRVARARPELAADILTIAHLYSAVRYGNQAHIDALRARVATFKP